MYFGKIIGNIYAVMPLCTVIILAITNCSSKKSPDAEAVLFENAHQAQIGNNFLQAIDIYQTIVRGFPASARLDKAIFMIAFIKSENLNDKQGALAYYQQILDKYPHSDLVDDAKFMVETIKSGQDPLSAFQKKIGQ